MELTFQWGREITAKSPKRCLLLDQVALSATKAKKQGQGRECGLRLIQLGSGQGSRRSSYREEGLHAAWAEAAACV